MTRGNAEQRKVVYKGKSDDFVCFIESIEILEKWKKDPSVPLAQVLNGWKVFCTHKYASSPLPPSCFILRRKEEYKGKCRELMGWV